MYVRICDGCYKGFEDGVRGYALRFGRGHAIFCSMTCVEAWKALHPAYEQQRQAAAQAIASSTIQAGDTVIRKPGKRYSSVSGKVEGIFCDDAGKLKARVSWAHSQTSYGSSSSTVAVSALVKREAA